MDYRTINIFEVGKVDRFVEHCFTADADGDTADIKIDGFLALGYLPS